MKAGFDPSKPDMHIGHSVLIHKLCQFQDLGHEVIFVVGDWTACIGDPSGQNKIRPALSVEEVKENSKTYMEQATKKNVMISRELDSDSQKVLSFFKRLDFSKTKKRYNSEWFDTLSLKEFILSVSSKFTVARQLERNDFFQRYKAGKPIGLHEFFYPVLQAYDSVELEADVEIGGTDQLFNLLLGRELQEECGQSQQVVLTLPLLEGLDAKRKWEEIHELKAYLIYRKAKENHGEKNKLCEELAGDEDFKKSKISSNSIKMKFENNRFLDTGEGLKNYSKKNEEIFNQYKGYSIEGLEKVIATKEREENWNIEGGQKMSKSLDNAISFNDSPKDMYGKIMKISDDLLVDYWRTFTEGEVNLKDVEDLDTNRKWEEIHELKAYLIYRKAKENHGEKNKLCEELAGDEDFKKSKISSNSIKMKFENNRFLDTGEGLKNYSKKNEEIFNQYKGYSIEGLEKEIEKKEREIVKKEKEKLAWLLVCSFHGEEKANHSKDEFKKVVSKGESPDQILEVQDLPPEKIKIYSLIKEVGLSSSSSEASRAILSGAVKKDGEKLTDPQDEIDLRKPKNKEFELSFGKRKFKRVNLKWKEIHELKALLVYKEVKEEVEEKVRREGMTEEEKNKLRNKLKNELCEKLVKDKDFKRADISLNSIKMKFENNRYLDPEGKSVLANCSKRNIEIFNQYESHSIEELRKEISKREKEENKER